MLGGRSSVKSILGSFCSFVFPAITLSGLNFSYHLNPPAYAPLHPSFGPLHGGTLAVLPGSYRFGTDRVCRIGGATGQRVAVQLAPRREISISRSGHKLREAPWGPGEDGDFAARLDAAAAETAAAAAAGGQEELLCEMPSVPTPGDTTVELSLNGQQYLGSSDGSSFPVPQIRESMQ